MELQLPDEWASLAGQITIRVNNSHPDYFYSDLTVIMVEHHLPTCNVRRGTWVPVSTAFLRDVDQHSLWVQYLLVNRCDRHIRPWLYPPARPALIELQPVRDWLRRRRLWAARPYLTARHGA